MEMKEKEVFFASEGITSTKANRVSDWAKGYYEPLMAKLESVRLYDVKVSVIDSDVVKTKQRGWTDAQLSDAQSILEEIARAKCLIAWFREAIKARDCEKNRIRRMTAVEFADMMGIEYPEEPRREKVITREDVLASMTVKERNRMYELETYASVYGKFIHPGRSFDVARSQYDYRLNNPCETEGKGHDMTITEYEPSVTPDCVNDTYFKLQQRHSEIQSELNGYEHKIERAISDDQLRVDTEYAAAMTEYNAKVREIAAKLAQYKSEKDKELSALKIIIPNDLKGVYERISTLGKE